MPNTLNPVVATAAHSSMNPETYGFVSTEKVLERLAESGWNMASTQIVKSRKVGREGFQRHLVRLESEEFLSIPGLSGDNACRPQIICLNAHDGTSAFRLLGGAFRFVCANGIITGTSLSEFRATHSGDLMRKVKEGVEHMVKGIPTMIEQVQYLQQTKFTLSAREELVKTLVDARMSTLKPTYVDYGSAVKVGRVADQSDDAFTVFNRIQEKLIRGGIQYRTMVPVKDEAGNVVSSEEVTRNTRRLASIAQSVRLNRLAYDTAIKLAA